MLLKGTNLEQLNLSFYCFWLPIQSNARGVSRMLVWGLMLLRSKLFYCLRLPIQSNARGGDQNASLGINAAWQQTLLLSPAPYPIQF